MRQSFFSILLWKSLARRRSRTATTLVAILLGACLVGTLLTLSMDIGRKAGTELQSYGANMLILPRDGLSAPGGVSEKLLLQRDISFLQSQQESGSLAYAPYLYLVVEANTQKAVLAGTNMQPASPLSSWWKVEGAWPDPAQPSQALVGVAAARVLGVQRGDDLSVRYGSSSLQLKVTGILQTGGSEDSHITAGLTAVQGLLGQSDAIGLVQVRTQAGVGVESLARQVEEMIPGSEARVVGQVAHAEEQVLGKVQMLLALVAGLVLLASSMSVSSTLTTAVLERTREIGLMKALGARDRSVVLILLTETVLLGFIGGLLGYLLGFILAEVIGLSVFASTIAPQPLALAVTTILALVVAIACCIVPVRRALAIDPAIILKGE